ncbi:SHOCT domain-containing protein [Leifsonia poae]|uniref:SHOCT domain-containing protein n=1 Tax=Leifsonia poae TaxID=110933 RepID=A0A9W6HCL0_9MICO|nr:hypothetical protein [Leifsonia poae]GLJ78004.1 hypothetical protein GCM10017584_35780 [Leifsonia poae]
MLSTLAAANVAAHWGGPWVGPWGAGFGWLFLLIPLFWIAVFVLIFTFAGRRWRRAAAARGGYGPYGGGYGPGAASRSAESTLAERFAQGDIDEVEYRARLEVLRANRGDSA